MPRKKRLTPKDKKIQMLETELSNSRRDAEYWKEQCSKKERCIESEQQKQSELREQRQQVEGFLQTMTDSVRQLCDTVREYGQPIMEPKPRRHPSTGEWIDPPQRERVSADRFIGYIEGSLNRIAIEGKHMQAPLVHVGIDMAAPDLRRFR